MSTIETYSEREAIKGLAHPDKLFIGGEWVAASSGRMIEIINPDTEGVVGAVAEGNEADMDRAVAAARKAFDDGPWPRMSVKERQTLLLRMCDELAKREAEIARVWNLQMGGLMSFAPMLSSVGTETFRYIVGMMSDFPFVERVPSRFSETGIIAREPVGVVAAIAPWNGPYAIMGTKVVNSLAAGCTGGRKYLSVLMPSLSQGADEGFLRHLEEAEENALRYCEEAMDEGVSVETQLFLAEQLGIEGHMREHLKILRTAAEETRRH